MSFICSYLLILYSLVTLEKFGLIEKVMAELKKSSNTSITNLLRRDLARVRKNVECYIMMLPQLSYIYWFIDVDNDDMNIDNVMLDWDKNRIISFWTLKQLRKKN